MNHWIKNGLGILLLAGSLSPAWPQPFVSSAEDRGRIEAALPSEAAARPLRPRRLLIFTLNVGYGGHPSMQHANEAFSQMGRKLGLYETEVSQDPEVFRPENLKRFDAVCFNNTVGNCFTNAALRRSLMEFITGGGGLLGFHGTTVAFTHWPGAVEDWPEFGFMIGARGANHRDSDEKVWLKVEDAQHPLTRVFSAEGFEFRDEYFRPQAPYSRDRVRVLLSMDLAKMDLNAGGPPRGATERPDNDYAVAWVRNYGRGRVFYSTMAHNPYVFWNTNLLRFYLNAIQFALGDLPAPTTPSARLTPAVRAQESLGWRLAVAANPFPKQTFFQTIENATQLGVPFIGGSTRQTVSADILKNFDADLNDQELEQVRLKLESAGLRLLTCFLDNLPADSEACRRVFEFGRKMGIETFVCAPDPNALDVVEKLANEYGINVALNPRAQDGRFKNRNLTSTLKQCAQRSRRIGVYGDMETWVHHGLDPVKAVRTLGDRLLVLQIHDLDGKSQSSHEVPWGTGVGRIERVVSEVQRLKLKPIMIGALVPPDSASLSPVRESIEFFNRTTLNLLPVGNRLP